MKRQQRATAVGCLILLLLSASGCHAQYWAEPIEARVIDAKTKEPLEGVIVVAHWVLKFGIERAGSEDLVAMETVTDENGVFRFPAWGPVRVPWELPADARFVQQDPEIILFKSGYQPDSLYNSDTQGPFTTPGPLVRRSQWNGKAIPLVKFEGSPEDYARILSGVTTELELTQCRWKKVPRLLAALDRDVKRLRSQDIRLAYGGQTTLDDIADLSADDDCGSVEEFFREYLQ